MTATRRTLLLLLLATSAPAATDADLTALVLDLAREGTYVPRTFRGEAGRAHARDLAAAFTTAGRETQEAPELLAAIARQESTFRAGVVGRHGEVGVMQSHPRWFPRGCGDVSRYARDVLYAVRCGARELARWRRECSRRLGHVASDAAVLAAYNSGRCDSPAGLRYARRVLARLHGSRATVAP